MPDTKPTQHITETFAHTLFVGNLPYDCTEPQLKELFEKARYAVHSVKIPVDPEEPMGNRGFGFVTLAQPTDAKYILSNKILFKMSGRRLRIQQKGDGK